MITSSTHRISFRARDGRVGRARKKATSTRKERTSVSGDEREREREKNEIRVLGNVGISRREGETLSSLGKLARILGKRGRNNLFANPSKTLRGTRATSKVFYESSALNKISNGQINTEEGNTRNRGEDHRWKFDREFDVATRGNEVGNGKKGKKRKKKDKKKKEKEERGKNDIMKRMLQKDRAAHASVHIMLAKTGNVCSRPSSADSIVSKPCTRVAHAHLSILGI